MFRKHGIPHSFELNKTSVADKTIGQLVAVNADGQAVTTVDASTELAFPLIEDVDAASDYANCTISGVAKVYVEESDNIEAGSEVGLGLTGLGVAAYVTGFKLGIALAKPKGDGDFIPVLLTPEVANGIY